MITMWLREGPSLWATSPRKADPFELERFMRKMNLLVQMLMPIFRRVGPPGRVGQITEMLRNETMGALLVPIDSALVLVATGVNVAAKFVLPAGLKLLEGLVGWVVVRRVVGVRPTMGTLREGISDVEIGRRVRAGRGVGRVGVLSRGVGRAMLVELTGVVRGLTGTGALGRRIGVTLLRFLSSWKRPVIHRLPPCVTGRPICV